MNLIIIRFIRVSKVESLHICVANYKKPFGISRFSRGKNFYNGP